MHWCLSSVGYICFTILGDDINVSKTTVMLNSTAIQECLDVHIENDILVEGTEVITLSLELIEDNTARGIRDVTPNTTDIIITDDDCELLLHLYHTCTYIRTYIHTYVRTYVYLPSLNIGHNDLYTCAL